MQDSDGDGSLFDDGINAAAQIGGVALGGLGGLTAATGALAGATGAGMGVAGGLLIAAGAAGSTNPLTLPFGLTAAGLGTALTLGGAGLAIAGAGAGVVGAGEIAAGGMLGITGATGVAGDAAQFGAGLLGSAAEGVHDFFMPPAAAGS